jgi:hypothetical protein
MYITLIRAGGANTVLDVVIFQSQGIYTLTLFVTKRVNKN